MTPSMLNKLVPYGLQLEITSDCNLRCTYCAVSQPSYEGLEIGIDRASELVQKIVRQGIKHVQISGHGETTTVDYWTELANQLIDSNIEISMISNMSRPLEDVEVEAFSNFNFIETSIDHCDKTINKNIRRKVDVRNQYENLLKIKAHSIKRGKPIPRLGFSIVVYDQNVSGLLDLVSMGVSLGVTHFRFCPLFKHPDIDGIDNVYPITSLTGSKLVEAKKSIDKTIAFLKRTGVDYLFMDGTLEALKRITSNRDVESEVPDRLEKVHVLPNQGETRNCLDPWSFSLLHSNGNASICCFAPPIGNWHMMDFIDIFQSEPANRYREGLLSGNMPEACRTCFDRPLIPIEELHLRVNEFMSQDREFDDIAIHARVNEIVKLR